MEVSVVRLVRIVVLIGCGLLTGGAASRKVAIVASAAVPGSGQIILGARGRGEAMLWVDAGMLAFYGGSVWARTERERDAVLMAHRDAGVRTSASNQAYWRALERYDNSDQYNEDVRREARSRYPDDPQRQHDYFLANGVFGDRVWDWSSDSARVNYYQLRKQARRAGLQAQFATGGLLLNRVVSVIDCALLASRNRQSRLRIHTPDDRLGLGLTLGI